MKWIFWGANGLYLVGRFDGRTFTPEQLPQRAEAGENGYAAQTWSDIPPGDGRRIQISWMRGGRYPYMPFNQQMSFPVQLELRSYPEGLRLCRTPVKEIESLHKTGRSWENQVIEAGKNFIPETEGHLFDIRAVIETGSAKKFGLYIHGTDLQYDAHSGVFTYLGNEIPTGASQERHELRLLVDRASLEIFTQDGKVSASFCFLPEARDVPLEFYAAGGSMQLASLTVYPLRSAWS